MERLMNIFTLRLGHDNICVALYFQATNVIDGRK
jgi:hypothetical protein